MLLAYAHNGCLTTNDMRLVCTIWYVYTLPHADMKVHMPRYQPHQRARKNLFFSVLN